MLDAELEALIANDERHWWYRGRRRIIRAVLDDLALPARAAILDVGCGSGRTLDELRAYGTVAGLDPSPMAVAAAQARGHDARLATAEAAPFPAHSFDLVTCLDVLEHTPDDRRTLSELLRLCRPGARLVVTVPAYQSLWSGHDEVNQHFRRYTARRLRAAAHEAGWQPGRCTYFNSILLVPAALTRLAQRARRGPAACSDLVLTPSWLNGTLELPLRIEARALRAGMRLPVGLSLLAVFRNPPTAPLTGRDQPQAPARCTRSLHLLV